MKKVTIHPMTEAEVEWLEQRLMDYGNVTVHPDQLTGKK